LVAHQDSPRIEAMRDLKIALGCATNDGRTSRSLVRVAGKPEEREARERQHQKRFGHENPRALERKADEKSQHPPALQASRRGCCLLSGEVGSSHAVDTSLQSIGTSCRGSCRGKEERLHSWSRSMSPVWSRICKTGAGGPGQAQATQTASVSSRSREYHSAFGPGVRFKCSGGARRRRDETLDHCFAQTSRMRMGSTRTGK
jgi:hypothetical protein